MERYQLQTLCIIVAGALFGFLPSLNVHSVVSVLLAIIIIPVAVLLSLVGTGLLLDVIHKDMINSREHSYPRIIGILSDLGQPIDGKTSSWSNISLEEWIEAIRCEVRRTRRRVIVKKITLEDKLDKITAIVNPYGGAYSEKDLSQQLSFKKIIEYVKQGGIFVNVADVPMYWAYRKDVGDLVETANFVWLPTPLGPLPARMFQGTPLATELRIEFYNVNPSGQGPLTWTSSSGARYQTDRATPITKRTSPVDGPIHFQNIDVTPFFDVNFGKGKFIISLYSLTGSNSNVANDIEHRICSHLLEDIPLEKETLKRLGKTSQGGIIKNFTVTFLPVIVLLLLNLPQAIMPNSQKLFIYLYAARRNNPIGAISSLSVYDGWWNLLLLAIAGIVMFFANLASDSLKSTIRAVVYSVMVFSSAILSNLFWLLTSYSANSQSSGTSGVTYASFGFLAGQFCFFSNEFLSTKQLHTTAKENDLEKRWVVLICCPLVGLVFSISLMVSALIAPSLFFAISGSTSVNWVVHYFSFWTSFIISMGLGLVSLIDKIKQVVIHVLSYSPSWK
jgi:hypothetical protein